MIPASTIADFISIGTGAIRGKFDINADTRRGSIYEQPVGAAAVIWSRQAQRDTDLFGSIRFATATGDSLTDYVESRYQIDRTLDTYGTGFVTVARSSSAGGAGIFRDGTRIIIASNAADPVYYAVAADTAVSGSALVATIPIRATQYGPGTAANAQSAKFDDALWDSSWAVTNLTCGDGTLFEDAAVYRARVGDELLLQRKGYTDEIIVACEDAGAAEAVLFPSYFNGSSDFGLNVCYVGDSSFQSPLSLINAVKIALESNRVCGDQLQVLPMQQTLVPLVATVNLWDAPTRFNLDALDTIVRAAMVRYFNATGFSYDLDAIAGEVRAVSDAVQLITFTTPGSSAPLMNGVNFPAILSRYVTQPSLITLTFAGPA